MSSEPVMRLTEAVEPERAEAHGTRWLWLDEAAALMGVTEGTLRRRCGDELHVRQLARMAKRHNGQRAWQISELADPKLARGAQTAPPKKSDTFGETKLTDAQREMICDREKIVTGWIAAKRGGAVVGMSELDVTTRYIDQLARVGTRISRRTIYRWAARFRKQGRQGLLDARSTDQANDAYPVYRERLLRLFLDQRQKTVEVCHIIACDAAEEAGETPPSVRTAYRIIELLDPGVVAMQREGRAAHADKIEGFITRDYESIDSNDWWCADHHPLDVLVETGKKPDGTPKLARPWLHAWQDVRSRMIVAWSIVAHAPNADLILRTFRRGVKQHGAPVRVYVDNGRDFDSRPLQGVTKKQRRRGASPNKLSDADRRRLGGAFPTLEVDVIHCWPYRGQSKPIERIFRTVKDRFCRLWDTFTGGNPTEKPEDLPGKIKAGHAPTLDEFAAAFARWVEDDYHHRVHLGDAMHGQTPAQVFSACLVKRRTISDERLAYACATRIGPLVVRQNGVHWQGLSWGRGAPELAERFGDKVLLAIDVEDTCTAFILDIEGRAICRVSRNEKLPWTTGTQEIRAAIAEKKSIRKSHARYMRDRARMSLDVPDLMLQAAAKRAQPQKQLATGTHDVPVSIVPVRTPVDDQLAALAAKPRRVIAPADDFDVATAFADVRKSDNQSPTLDMSDLGSAFGQGVHHG